MLIVGERRKQRNGTRTDQNWTEGYREHYENPRKGHQGEWEKFCECKKRKKKIDIVHSTAQERNAFPRNEWIKK